MYVTDNHKLRHVIEMPSTVVKDSLLHKCPQLSRIALNHCLRQPLLYSDNLLTATIGLTVTYK